MLKYPIGAFRSSSEAREELERWYGQRARKRRDSFQAALEEAKEAIEQCGGAGCYVLLKGLQIFLQTPWGKIKLKNVETTSPQAEAVWLAYKLRVPCKLGPGDEEVR
ncbi:MAG: hypothetical protein DRP11_01515 [Candidatus Aenigmatarchaeota archaeon]|nr:MAG: hypothetical protein DRP11_01515 [Candidatus Aenigmarchaeota archaeon]